MLGLSNISALNTSESANVTIASVTPRVRIAGRATSTPTAVAATTPINRATRNGTSRLLAERAAAHAPKPASAYWQSDSWPA